MSISVHAVEPLTPFRQLTQILILLLVVLLAYGHTLDVPFYLDDYSSIRENPLIRDIDRPAALFDAYPARFIGYLSFAVNYELHGYQLAGYHITNILIHALTSLVVLLLVSKILDLPRVREQVIGSARVWLPISVALLFALHPLQTQAVTYIVQRLASMTALFYLMSLLCYLHCRTAGLSVRALGFALLLIGSATIALLTKQNAATLPIAIVLVEIVFFGWRSRVLAGMLVAAIVVAILLAVSQWLLGIDIVGWVLALTSDTQQVTRMDYLATQMGVIWWYVYQFFLPVTLHLDYDVSIRGIGDFTVWLAAGGHIIVLTIAVWLMSRRPVLALAIAFYYLSLSIESSVIPIRDLAFEHRTYLPNFGLALLTGWLVLIELPRQVPAVKSVHALAIFGVVLVLFGSLTWQRNNLWRDPIAFFEHEMEASPRLLRPVSMLGEMYLRQEADEKALATFRAGLPLIKDQQQRPEVVVQYFQNFVLILNRTGRHDEALAMIDLLDLESQSTVVQSNFMMLRGNAMGSLGRLDEARRAFEASVTAYHLNMDARLSLGKVHYLEGDLAGAGDIFEELLRLDPDDYSAPEARRLLEAIRQQQRGNLTR